MISQNVLLTKKTIWYSKLDKRIPALRVTGVSSHREQSLMYFRRWKHEALVYILFYITSVLPTPLRGLLSLADIGSIVGRRAGSGQKSETSTAFTSSLFRSAAFRFCMFQMQVEDNIGPMEQTIFPIRIFGSDRTKPRTGVGYRFVIS